MHYIKKALRIISYIFEGIKYVIFYPLAFLIYGNKTIYLFSERGTDARDNAYHLYKFFREKHPELNAYYVITKNSADREKIEQYGNIVNYRSIKHYLLFIVSKYKISTHIMGFSPNFYFYTKMAKKLKLRGYKIFLQHGVTTSNLKALYKSEKLLDVFICGAKPEYDFISKNFGYDNNELKYTGFSRYDSLYNIEPKNQILCMPTWRRYVTDNHGKFIKNSEYVTLWNSFLNNPRLIKALKENNLNLIFYPHYQFQKYLSAFSSSCSEVVIASFNDYDVQQLLKESKLLITDYSSVYFDFAYMKKPVVYYQFDKERFFGEHYDKGYFDFENMGFGEVTNTENELIESTISYINNKFESSPEYLERCDAFFQLHDSQNCQRIFNVIEDLQ